EPPSESGKKTAMPEHPEAPPPAQETETLEPLSAAKKGSEARGLSGTKEEPKAKRESDRPAPAAGTPKRRVLKAGESFLTKDKKSVVIALEDDPVVLRAAQSLIESGDLPPGSVVGVVHGTKTEGGSLLGGVPKELEPQFGSQLRQAKDFLKASGGEPKRG